MNRHARSSAFVHHNAWNSTDDRSEGLGACDASDVIGAKLTLSSSLSSWLLHENREFADPAAIVAWPKQPLSRATRDAISRGA